MMTSKSAQLSITLKSVALIKELSLGLAPIGCVAVRNFCNEISRTLINQAGEIDSLNAHAQNLATAYNSYEVHWDSLIFAIMGADAKADIIDGVDIERTTTAAIEAVKKLASERDENLRVAEAFQAASNLEYASIHRDYHNGAHVGNIRYPSELIEIFRAGMVSKLKEDIEKARSIGRFQEIYVNVPSGHAGIAFDPSAELTKSIQDNARNHYRKMMESEISDFVAGLGHPGEPTTPKQFQDVLMKRVASVFTNATQTE
ncbi:hypothetical protein ACT3RT_21345 [Ewingella sp. AOP9-I1-14]